MDISLNISNSVKTKEIYKKNSPPKEVKKKKSSYFSNGNNEFSFNFTPNKKVKAIVAKRRVKKDGTKLKINELNSALSSKVNEKSKTTNDNKSISKPTRNYVMAPPDSIEDDDDKEFSIITKNLDSNEISLNVTTFVDENMKEKKKRLTREERLKEKRLKRKGEYNQEFITPEKLKEGLNKFSNENYNKTEKKTKNILPEKKKNLFEDVEKTATFGQRLVKPITEKVFTGVSMDSINLHPHHVKNLTDILNIKELTVVQQMTIPKALEGKDILVRSQTGSGKTLAYAVPIIQKLQEIRPKLSRTSGIYAVVIVPTREIALQTYEVFLKLVKPFTWLVPGYLVGGEKRKSEKARIRKGINILIGTPGRLVDHLLHTETLKLNKVDCLIIDEADRLLEMDFERDVKKIVDAIKDHKQGIFSSSGSTDNDTANNINLDEGKSQLVTKSNPSENEVNFQRLLLSATLTPAVQRLAGLTLKNPILIDTSDEHSLNFEKSSEDCDLATQEAIGENVLVIPSTVQLNYIIVPPKLRLVVLCGLLAKECASKKSTKALVFMSTVEMVNFHHDLMNEVLTQKRLDDEDDKESNDEDINDVLLKGVRLFKLHGSMTQTERKGVFKEFRETKSGVLLATDVAGRGIDVPEVDLIVQYSPPQKIPDFVHRVGRTARAGRSGRAIIFLGPSETEFIRILEDKRIRISQVMMDEYLDELRKSDDEAHTSQEAASNLQHRFGTLLKEDQEMHTKACKAFSSWVCFYSTFLKELKSIFNLKAAHMGHYAKSFALSEPPRSCIKQHAAMKAPLPTNRLTYTERDPEKIKAEKNRRKRSAEHGKVVKNVKNPFNKFLAKSISLSTSEFDSGLPPMKKKKKV